MSQKRNFVVTVKEDTQGKPWLLIELHEDIGLSQDQHITFWLPEDTQYEDAEKIATYINSKLQCVRVSNS